MDFTPMLGMLKAQFNAMVPFSRFCGIEIDDVRLGEADASLPERAELGNHIGSQHAAAMFLVGETASGLAATSVFAPLALTAKPVAHTASIQYLKVAKGRIQARAQVEGEPEVLFATLQAEGKIEMDVLVRLVNSAEVLVAEMRVKWHVTLPRP